MAAAFTLPNHRLSLFYDKGIIMAKWQPSKTSAVKVSAGHYRYRGFDIYDTAAMPWQLRNSWEYDAKNPWYTRFPEEMEVEHGCEEGYPVSAPTLRSMKYTIDYIWGGTDSPDKHC